MARAITRCVKMGFSLRDWFYRRGGVIIAYALLVTLLFISVLYFFENSKDEVFGCRIWKNGDQVYCRAKGCKIVCKDVDWKYLRKHVEVLAEDHCDSELEISIHFAGFLEGDVKRGWLKFLNQRVKRLYLKDYPFPSLGDSAFSGHPFTNLHRLTIRNSRLSYLKKLWFLNLPTLQELQIVFDDGCPVEDFWIEEGVLEGMPSLETLKINQCLNQAQQILNMTGYTAQNMAKLVKLDLSDNKLRVLPPYSFISARNLEFLSLHDNMLQGMSEKSLWPAPLTNIEISNNNLQVLSRDTFRYSNLKNNSIKAYGNPWECGCELQWLKEFYVKENSPVNKIRPLLCSDGRRFEDVDFSKCKHVKFELLERKIGGLKSMNSCSPNGCSITCTAVTYDSLVDSINQAVEKCTILDNLKLESISFPNGKISYNWLERLTVPTRNLELKKCNFDVMDDGVFSGHPFVNLDKLVLVDPGISHIRKLWFDKIKYLTTFELRYDVIPPVNFWIELGSFGNLHKLNTLQFINCLSDEDHVRNITGPASGFMKDLLTLDVSYNALNKLSAMSFVNAPKLLKLVIRDNWLEEIERDAFVGTSLRYLEISGNLLKTLPEGVFRVFEKADGQNKSVFASNNPWNCDCNLLWFKHYYLRNDSFIDKQHPLLCTNVIPFEESDFVCSAEETTERTESSYGTTRELSLDERIISVPCRDINHNPVQTRGDVNNHVINIALLSNNHNINIRFIDLNDDIITTEIDLEGEVRNFHLLWFNSFNPSEKDCITNLHNRPIYLENLQRAETYTFCLVYNDETSVSPYSCFGTTIPENWERRSWIPNSQKVPAIATFASTVILTAAIFSTSMFFIIRKRPELIKGNKRVIVLGSKEIAPCPPLPRRDSGYLTPNCPIYEKVQYRTGLRGAGENSISGYITALENPYKVQAAPPLPPCHPVLSRSDEDASNRNTSCA